MIDINKVYLVTNRSASRVFYAVPDFGVKAREFQAGETKRLPYGELEGLSQLPGGMDIIRDYLQIKAEDAREELIGNVEPEYNMTDAEVKELILHGSMDEWLDCLDFAPEGVIDLIKTLSVELPLNDTRKMQSFKEKKGIDLERMIRSKEEERAEEAAAKAAAEAQAQQRRVVEQPSAPSAPQRRTSGSKYKVVNKDTATE